VEDLRGKLELAGVKMSECEDRVREMDKAMEEQKIQQHKLVELAARLLTKKHRASTGLELTQNTIRNLEIEHSVRHISLDFHFIT